MSLSATADRINKKLSFIETTADVISRSSDLHVLQRPVITLLSVIHGESHVNNKKLGKWKFYIIEVAGEILFVF